MAVEGSACILLAVLLLTVPLPWVGAALTAACFHELCHWAALKSLGVRVRRFSVRAEGAALETEPMTGRQELVCALAGPAGSLCLLALLRWIPRIALCAGIQGAFNLLPVWPLDGGRAVECLLKFRYSEEKAEFYRKILETITLTAVLLAGITLSFVYFMGIAPVLMAAAMVMKAKMRKTLAKSGPSEYNRLNYV